MAIYLALGTLSAAAVLAYAAFARFFPQSSVITVFVWFVVAQILLWMRWRPCLLSRKPVEQLFRR